MPSLAKVIPMGVPPCVPAALKVRGSFPWYIAVETSKAVDNFQT